MEGQISVTVPVELSGNEKDLLDLGTWLGRHQAITWIARQCSAADAHLLSHIREHKLYKPLGLNWKDFCDRHAGVCYKTAEQIIARLHEFGESYFNLAEIVPIKAAEYRALQPAIAANAIEIDGEKIPIKAENAARIAAAVDKLRLQLKVRTREGEKACPSKPVEILVARVDRFFGELAGHIRRRVGTKDREMILCVLDGVIDRTMELRQWVERKRD